mgnify:CR=1 FL=1
MGAAEAKQAILDNRTSLGIEFGSTRIKAVLVGEDNAPIASGSHEWENRFDNGVWTYTLEDIWTGLQDCYRDLAVDVKKQYDVELTTVGALGFSAMMHGYMVFDKAGEQLVPFRTWRNTMTEQAAKELTELFRFNMPQRWSGAHLYQAILNKEEHVKDIDFITTLAGYVHWKLTGEKVLGVGDASGMFPIDSTTRNWNKEMLAKFDELVAPYGFPWIFAGNRQSGELPYGSGVRTRNTTTAGSWAWRPQTTPAWWLPWSSRTATKAWAPRRLMTSCKQLWKFRGLYRKSMLSGVLWVLLKIPPSM